ncbi:lysine-rich nucleolar protein 1 [Austrofundulus limnaeus]|uniref:Lysine-rich nucleolar protein 1 n=1 Tax=Austrofundulus limnaeus TaxID=52670 RepID=A0A2I4CQQ8_AUSLI|nr:PREDICTED: lysine-rich nucleolar protein 1 [Austrofundulus limnaeus]
MTSEEKEGAEEEEEERKMEASSSQPPSKKKTGDEADSQPITADSALPAVPNPAHVDRDVLLERQAHLPTTHKFSREPLYRVIKNQPPPILSIELDHNPFKCPSPDCPKSFRKASLLHYHIKYYHSDQHLDPEPHRRKRSSSDGSDFTCSRKPETQSSCRHDHTEQSIATAELKKDRKDRKHFLRLKLKKKKKKKKKKQMMDEVVDKVESVLQCVIKDKSKKKKNKSLLIKSENTEEEEQYTEEERIQKKDVKLKKRVRRGSIEQTEDVGRKKKRSKKETSVTIDDVTKKKRKAKGEENEIKLETPEVEVEEVKLKKKKKKEKTKESGGLEAAEINNKEKRRAEDKIHRKKKDNYTEEFVTEEGKAELKTKSKKNRCKAASVEDVQQEETEPKKRKATLEEWDAGEDTQSSRKHKKSKCRTTSVEDTQEEETEPKKKKKKTRLKEWGVGEDTHSSGNKVTKAADTHHKKSKKTKVKVEPELNTEAGVKKMKEQKDSQKASLLDVVFMSKKAGNTDEVTINQERRKALQMQIDEASQPQNPTKPTGLGQWSTAQFDSSQQQQKFLRLMGGFKKGFQPAVATSGSSNMALGKDAQQQLQQGLLGEFERAHSRRMDFGSRGAGLGFAASPNKKFSIDINASRSIRFDY